MNCDQVVNYNGRTYMVTVAVKLNIEAELDAHKSESKQWDYELPSKKGASAAAKPADPTPPTGKGTTKPKSGGWTGKKEPQ